MLLKFFKIFFFISFLIFQSSVYSKNNNNEFNSKNLSNYFSAIVSYDNQKNVDSLKFFKSSKSLINRHDPFLKKYIFSLIIEGEMNRAIHELKHFSGKKNAILSNKPVALIEKILKALNFLQHFDSILGGDSLNVQKPDPKGLQFVMNKLDCPAKKVLMVGDGAIDIETGKRAGVLTCGVTYGFGDPNSLRDSKPDYLIGNLSNLKSLFN